MIKYYTTEELTHPWKDETDETIDEKIQIPTPKHNRWETDAKLNALRDN